MSESLPRLGISACLLGKSVRYDGKTKLDQFLVDVFEGLVRWVPVCPEVECGMSVPREPIQLRGDPQAPRLVVIKTGKDLTYQMLNWAARRLGELERESLAGFIFKSRSPSSGLRKIPVHDRQGIPCAQWVGLFASAFMKKFPKVPVEDEIGMRDSFSQKKFIDTIWENPPAILLTRLTLGGASK